MQLRTEIEIDAPSSIVWDILVSCDRYHEWNPFITTLEGKLAEGARVSVVVSPPDASDFRFRAVILKCDQEQELRWKGSVLADFVFRGEHYLKLESLGPGRTRVIHGEDFGGLLLKLLGKQMTSTARGFVFMNQALKRRAEAHVARATG